MCIVFCPLENKEEKNAISEVIYYIFQWEKGNLIRCSVGSFIAGQNEFHQLQEYYFPSEIVLLHVYMQCIILFSIFKSITLLKDY